jgi:hypothetical protein
MLRSSPLLLAAAALAAGCDSSSDPPNDPGCDHAGECVPCEGDDCECVGDLYVTVPIEPPQTMTIAWDGEVAVNECDDLDTGRLRYQRLAGVVELNLGGPGFVPPDRFSLEIVDTGDCIVAATTAFSITDRAVDGAPFSECAAVRIDL